MLDSHVQRTLTELLTLPSSLTYSTARSRLITRSCRRGAYRFGCPGSFHFRTLTVTPLRVSEASPNGFHEVSAIDGTQP